MDFSKVNLSNPTAGSGSKPVSPPEPTEEEVSKTSTSNPHTGLNFKGLNLGKPGNSPQVSEDAASDSSTTVVDSVEKIQEASESKPEPFKLSFPAHTGTENNSREVVAPIANPVHKPIAKPVVVDNVANVEPVVEPVREVVSESNVANASKVPVDLSLVYGNDSLASPEDDVENPFLDEDDEYVLNVQEISEGGSTGSSYDPEAADAEPFLGFPDSSRSVDSVASSREGDDFGSDNGFDDLLDDLLEDESYESSPIAKPVDEVVEPIANPVVKPDVPGGSGASGEYVANVANVSDRTQVALDDVREVSRREIPLDDSIESDRAKRREEKKVARAEGRAKRETGKKKESSRVRLESDFVKQAPVEVLVDERGRPVVRASSGSESNVANDSDRKEKKRYRYLRSDGKINVAEQAFFKNLQSNKSKVLSTPSEMARLRGPVDRNETEAERLERQKQIVRAASGRKGMQRGKQPRFGQKEREVLEFLAMFRYATDRQLSRMFSESQGTTYNRLKRLRQQGLVIDKKIYGNRPIWFLTDAGLVISGYDLPRVTESKLTFSMFPHQFTVNNTAANLWGANVNVLNMPDYPAKHRLNSKGEMTFGENLVSELEIQSSFGKVKGFDKSDVYRPQLLGNIDREFRDWERAGGPEFGPSPEMVYGNEYMWSLMPPYNVHLAYHVPDLVIKRPRNADGTPNSIAVEIEISNKPSDSYEKTLYAYRADMRLYKKVIWVCKSAGPARKLETIAKEIGLWQAGKIDIVPVITEDGVFKERDLWTI